MSAEILHRTVPVVLGLERSNMTKMNFSFKWMLFKNSTATVHPGPIMGKIDRRSLPSATCVRRYKM